MKIETEKTMIKSIQEIIDKHTDKLNIMKGNLSRWEEENWSDAEIHECENMIRTLASILSDLNKTIKSEDNISEIKKSDVASKLCLGNFTINKPDEWDLDSVKLEIKDYDYDSTNISIDSLKILNNYIDDILTATN